MAIESALHLSPKAGHQAVPDTSLNPPTADAILLAMIEQGDENAMADLYDRHSRIVFAAALRVLHERSAAEDVLQEVFLRVWRKPSGFEGARGSLGAWLSVIARNRAIDVLRRRRPTDSVDDVPLACPGDLSEHIEQRVMVERIRSLIQKLPPVQQRVLELAFFQDMTHAEIAAQTRMPLGTIKTRIRTALQSLCKALNMAGVNRERSAI